MVTTDKKGAQGRRGLCPWGLTHRLKLEKQPDSKLYRATTVYSVRIKLPKYLYALLRSRTVKESEMRIQANGLKARVMNYTDTTNEVSAKVLDINYLIEQPEITIQVTIVDDIYNKARISGILRKFREYINQFLDVYRDILGGKIREVIERSENFDNGPTQVTSFLNYRIVTMNKGTELETECIRYTRRP